MATHFLPASGNRPQSACRPRLAGRAAFTLIELLMVVAVIAILASLLVPAIGLIRERANQESCGKNQASIVTACLAYSGDFDAPWPIGESSATRVATVAAAPEAFRIAARSFEVLAASMALPNALFKCRSATVSGPVDKPGLATSGDTWGAGAGSARISYAYDWAAPGDPGAIRVMTADRTRLHHRGSAVMVAYADAHTRRLDVERGGTASGNQTEGAAAAVACNPEATGTDDDSAALSDNVFDDAGDVTATEQVFAPAKASARRAFVK